MKQTKYQETMNLLSEEGKRKFQRYAFRCGIGENDAMLDDEWISLMREFLKTVV